MTAHTRFDIKFHLAWHHEVPQEVVCEAKLASGSVHLFVSSPPHVSASYLVQRLKEKSFRKLMQEISHLKKYCWDRHLGAGVSSARSGNVTDEVIMEYIRTQEMTNDDDFRVERGSTEPEVGLSANLSNPPASSQWLFSQ